MIRRADIFTGGDPGHQPQQRLHRSDPAAALGAFGSVPLEPTAGAGREIVVDVVRQVPLRPLMVTPAREQADRRTSLPVHRMRRLEQRGGAFAREGRHRFDQRVAGQNTDHWTR
jgi:hypothetical protein